MQRIDRIFGWGILAVGLLHSVLTPLLFPDWGTPALWFLSGGIALMFLGAFNLLRVRYGGAAPGLRRVCLAANLTIAAFLAAMIQAMGRPPTSASSLLLVCLVAGETLFSLRRPGRSARGGEGNGASTGS